MKKPITKTMKTGEFAFRVSELELEYKEYKRAQEADENPIASPELIQFAKMVKNEIITNPPIE